MSKEVEAPAPFWTLEEALKLIRALQPDTRTFGYHLCMGGGVMNKGMSEKDLDLFFLPMCGGGYIPEPKAALVWLTQLWGDPEQIGREDYDEQAAPRRFQIRNDTIQRLTLRQGTIVEWAIPGEDAIARFHVHVHGLYEFTPENEGEVRLIARLDGAFREPTEGLRRTIATNQGGTWQLTTMAANTTNTLGWATEEIPQGLAQTKAKKSSPYWGKYKFNYSGLRIDVFIIE